MNFADAIAAASQAHDNEVRRLLARIFELESKVAAHDQASAQADAQDSWPREILLLDDLCRCINLRAPKHVHARAGSAWATVKAHARMHACRSQGPMRAEQDAPSHRSGTAAVLMYTR